MIHFQFAREILGLDEFIFANDLVDSDKHLCWLHRLSSGLPDYRQRMGFACQQNGFVLCLSYPCWRTVPRGSGGDLEGGFGYPHRSTNLQITGTVTGEKYERRTRVPLLVFECHYWLVTACIRRTECCICLSLYWGPHVISHCLLSQGCSNFFAWGSPPDLFILVYKVCLPCSSHIYVQAAVGLRLKGLLVFHDFPTDNLYLLITCTSLRFEA